MRVAKVTMDGQYQDLNLLTIKIYTYDDAIRRGLDVLPPCTEYAGVLI